jgi:dethiobiotin synthetase
MSGFFITGTDTGVGKTFATCALIHSFRLRGLTVAPMKPVAAGTVDVNGAPMNEDVALLMDATGHRFPLHAVNPYCFKAAIAPHIAASQEGAGIDMAVVRTAYRHLAGCAELVLVEGAGGFLVPLSETESMALIPAALQLPVILVVGMRLGCINHALLTQEAIRSRGLALAGWVANNAASGGIMNAYDENLSTLTRVIDAPLIGNMTHAAHVGASDMLAATRAAASQLSTEILVSTPQESR